MNAHRLPRILIIDDVYGRTFSDRRNRDREDLCFRLGIQDISGDEVDKGTPERIHDPVAEAVFCSGQIAKNGQFENDLSGTLELVRKGWQNPNWWALVLLDLHFKTGLIGIGGDPTGIDSDYDPKRYFGMILLENLHRHFPEIPVLIFSAMPRNQVSLDFAGLGAVGFLQRETASREELKDYLWRHGLLEDTRPLKKEDERYRILGHSFPLLLALREARRLAKGDNNILILGESGTGKELLARYIHYVSPSKDGPFQVLFTQDTTESIFEDKLFGHVKGAFTGSSTGRAGAAELASGGTLFIDECGDIPPAIQHKFLRLLDEKTREVERMGSNKAIRLQLQVVLATNKDISVLKESGGFRRDLLHRISGQIVLPPLRERREDVPFLVEEFVKRGVQSHKGMQREITPDAMQILVNSSWPGNIRELQQVVENAMRKFPDVEHLVPVHLDIRTDPLTLSSENLAARICPQRAENDTDSLIRGLDEFSFGEDYSELYGKLPAIQQSIARLLARYLKAALLCHAVRKFSPESPEGEINLTGAVKCITGQKNLSTSQAADIVKRLLQSHKGLIEEILQDPVLSGALENALKLRPKTGRSRLKPD